MVAFKHVLLASLAALAVASPASTQQEKPRSSSASVAHQGGPGWPAAGDGTGPQEHGSWQQAGKGEAGEYAHKVPAGMGNDKNKYSQHQPRNEGAMPNHQGHSNSKWEHAESPDKNGDDDRHNRHHTRNANPSIDLDHDDPMLSQMREMLGAHNETESHEHEGRHHLGRRGLKGIYECMNHNFVAPCKWTEIKSESQCYNAFYNWKGSMGPDKGLCCTIYEKKNCNKDGWQTIDNVFHYPGIPDYGKSPVLIDNGMNDEGIVSLKCKFKDC
ncbi:hypothetical protein A1O7_08845 [Cladophialophora yegresii CBS 114405]|uniref:Uncharacterized protein n=1 Tax=Cladophialophora yegresii CBS 114405 TaxID=1182544 RepID=W9WBK5_9EURO|nr:uncharacterized protein A1O7_08845 [Cladophialophora yegresii CBS 114405]EXJ55914.1 hypothetical protein A1O7_08845 [Cladophialophora yegresii CBS 114405]